MKKILKINEKEIEKIITKRRKLSNQELEKLHKYFFDLNTRMLKGEKVEFPSLPTEIYQQLIEWGNKRLAEKCGLR